MPNKLVVISDLHMSAQALDDFDTEIEQKFVLFLSSLKSRPESIELVINGDFLDFVQAPPVEEAGLSLDDTRCVMKLTRQPLSLDQPVGDHDDSYFGEFLEDHREDDPLYEIGQEGLRNRLHDVRVRSNDCHCARLDRLPGQNALSLLKHR